MSLWLMIMYNKAIQKKFSAPLDKHPFNAYVLDVRERGTK
jgi:hypothetical protein